MGAVAAEAHRAAAVDGDADAAAPGQAVHRAVDGLHLDRMLDARHPAQLLGHPERLEAALRAQLDVLVVAPPAATGPGVGARGRHPIRGRFENFDGVGPKVGLRGGGHAGPHPLAGQGMADEHDPAVRGSGHAAAAGGGGARLQLQHLVARRNGRRHRVGAYDPGRAPAVREVRHPVGVRVS